MSAPTTFALRWLIPRLELFHGQRPEVEVTVTTTTTLHEELRGGFDVAIRRGLADRGAWPQHRPTAFLPETDTLIVSPALFEREPLRQPSDIEPCAAHERDAPGRLGGLARTRRPAAPNGATPSRLRPFLCHAASHRRRSRHRDRPLARAANGYRRGSPPDAVSGNPGSKNRLHRPQSAEFRIGGIFSPPRRSSGRCSRSAQAPGRRRKR